MTERAALLFYCQHSLGMGHLVRSLVLAAGFTERFRVVFLNGGPLPKGLKIPDGVRIVNLPPLGLGPDGRLLSRDGRRTVERAQKVRLQTILETYRALQPQVVFIELFPFGRKKFAGELLPLLEATRDLNAPSRPLVCCSLRDILVGKKSDQQKHDERAVAVANKYFDAVMVHSDPEFARLEESLVSYKSLRTPVYYTGFAGAESRTGARVAPTRHKQILVSAGGGLVGERLFRTAVEAYALLGRTPDVRMKIIAGPFLPKEAWASLRAEAHARPGLSVERFVPDLCAEMRASAASISQGGYNTTLDILRAAVPALVVPFADGSEDEQLKRARRLERRGAIRVLEQHELDAKRLAHEMRRLLDFKPRRLRLDLDGARNTARIADSLLEARNQKQNVTFQRLSNEREVHP
ncbi:MAG TPA: glycosyltransferase [Pyrinomonadaceae bacterium]|jgi:predicted glycosyltransferase|nr:glycosyltransferase [Pyrinomonadaceae bacterium]